MCRIQELFRKEVINMHNGERMGFVCDVEVDVLTGCLVSIIVPGCKGFSLFNKEETVIPWCEIKRIGDDLILVDCTVRTCPTRKDR